MDRRVTNNYNTDAVQSGDIIVFHGRKKGQGTFWHTPRELMITPLYRVTKKRKATFSYVPENNFREDNEYHTYRDERLHFPVLGLGFEQELSWRKISSEEVDVIREENCSLWNKFLDSEHYKPLETISLEEGLETITR